MVTLLSCTHIIVWIKFRSKWGRAETKLNLNVCFDKCIFEMLGKFRSDLTEIEKTILGASLVAQWLRTRLPMQETWVRALLWEAPTCCGATKPVHHNYWACAPEPASHNYWACAPQLLKPTCSRACAPQQEKPPQWGAHAPQQRIAPLSPELEKARVQQRRPNAAKNN